MRVLITGANGFLGKKCTEKFQADHVTITTDIVGEVDYKGDLSDKCFVNKLPEVDVVINCAAVQYVSSNLPLFSRKKYFEKNNIRTAELIANKYSKTYFINIGTSMMYKGNTSGSYFTHNKIGGNGVYSRSKTSAQIVFENKIDHLATIIPCIIGGKGREGLFKPFIKSISMLSIVILPGASKFKTGLVHVDDVADLIKILATKKIEGRYNASSEDSLSILEWISIIKRKLNKDRIFEIKIPIKLVELLAKISCFRLLAEEQVNMLKMNHTLDIKKTKEIGWQPKYKCKDIILEITDSLMK